VDAQFAEVEEVKGWKMAGGRPFISEKEKLRLQARSAVAWQAQLFDHRRQVRPWHHENQSAGMRHFQRSFNRPITVQKELLFSVKREGRSFRLGKRGKRTLTTDIYVIRPRRLSFASILRSNCHFFFPSI
jgi:hypothetical protein